MTVEIYSVDSVPDHVLRFWREEGMKQDQVGLLTHSPEWFTMMCEAHDDEALVLSVTNGDGECCLVLPLLLKQDTSQCRVFGRVMASRSLRVFRVCGGDILASGDGQELLAEALDHIALNWPDVDALWFDHVSSDERVGWIVAATRDSGAFGASMPFTQIPHYRLRLPATSVECLGIRSKRSIDRLLAKERALCRELDAGVALVEVRTSSEIDEHVEMISSLMDSSWQAALRGRRFSEEDMRHVAQKGWLRSFLLMVGGKPAAFTLCYQGMGTLIYEELSYDRELAKFSPGALLLMKIIGRLYEEDKPQYIDFGEGEADYKKQFSNDTIHVTGCMLVRHRPSLTMWVAGQSFCRHVDDTARFFLDKMKLRKSVTRKRKERA